MGGGKFSYCDFEIVSRFKCKLPLIYTVAQNLLNLEFFTLEWTAQGSFQLFIDGNWA